MKRRLSLFFGIAMVLTVCPMTAATRLVDFESPATTRTFQPVSPETYSAFNGEVRFTQGWRSVAAVWEGWPPSTSYFNFSAGQVVVLFSVPVKNISFTMYSFFYNTDRASSAIIKYSSIAFDPSPRTLSPNPLLFYAPHSGGGTAVNVPFEGIRYLVISFGAEVFSIDDFMYETTDTDTFTAFARFKTPGSSLQPESGRAAVASMAVNIPLGTLFTVGLEKKQGFLLPVEPVTSAYTVASHSLEPYKYTWGKRLFTSSPVVDVGSTAPSEERGFIAVHLGTVSVVVTPVSMPGPTVTMNISIVRPSALGTAENDWDKAIIDAAHERGIPPQMIKGQIAQESDGVAFKGDNFRYEPCSADATYISAGPTKINSLPYSAYALESARGSTLLDQTIAPRNRYYILDGVGANGQPIRRHLLTSDANITAKQIWDANDKWPPGTNHGMNWSTEKCATLKKYLDSGAPPANFSTNALTFVAQTPTASSYGVMQMMYATALFLGWSVPGPAKPAQNTQDPYYLLDIPANLQIDGGGSIPVGTHLDADHFPTNTAAFADAGSVESRFTTAFQKYNIHKTGYGAGVIAFSHNYLPLQTGLVFP